MKGRLRHPCLLAVLLLGCGASDEQPPATTTTGTSEGGAGGGLPIDAGAEIICPPGELLLGDGSCLPPGIEECAPGFESDGRRACVAVLPAAPCASGFMAVPGDETCRPIASCGSGAYDGIPVEPSTVYVDPTHVGASDGSLAMPYPTLAEGIAAAPGDAIVALAPGTYGPAVIAQPVRLWATCPDAVTFEATMDAAIRVEADGVELHRVSVTGRGVVVDAASGVLISEARLHDTSNVGLLAENGAEVTLADSLVERTTGRALLVRESTVTVERSEIRDGIPNAGGSAFHAAGTNAESTLSITDSWLHHGRGKGLETLGGQLRLERSVLSDTQSNDGNEGSGIYVQVGAENLPGSLELRDAIIERNVHHGIVVYGSELDAERAIVRDLVSHTATTSSGRCLRILAQNGVPPSALLSQSVIERCQDAGILATQAAVTVETSIIRDIEPHPVTNQFGIGLVAASRFGIPSTLEVRGLSVERTSTAGVLVAGSTANLDTVYAREPLAMANEELGFGVAFTPGLEDSLSAQGTARQIVIEDAITVGFVVLLADVVAEDLLIRDSRASSAGFGDGLAVSGIDPNVTLLTGAASLQASRITIEGSERAGLAVFSATASLDHGRLSCNTIHLNVESIEGVGEGSLGDAGNNACGCDGEPALCKVQSSGLEPPGIF